MSNANQKGTALSGGAVSDEVLASSASILQPNSYGSGQKGLQQFYSPEAVAKLAHDVIGHHVATLDPTAGDGSLLKFWDKPRAFGIEIDPDQVKNSDGSYNAIKGDLQHVYPLLRTTLRSWEGIVANPPFGLMWSDPSYRDGKPTNSTVLTFVYMNRLLSDDGQLVFICGRDRFYRQVADLPEAAGIYAVVECEDMFEGTTLPCVMAFGINPNNRAASSQGFVTREVSIDMLDLLSGWVTEQRENALGGYNSVARSTYGYHLPDRFETIQKEYDRRLEGRVKKNREYDALLVGGKVVQWLPSAYAQLALQTENDAYAFHGLNGQNINYFTSNERLWNKLLQYRDAGLITIEPKLYDAVEATIGSLRKERVPLYAVKPQQRLGFLTDIEFLRCKKADPEKGFVVGDAYRLDTRTQTIVEREERVVESKKNPGEYTTKTFEKQKKALKITVGHHSILDGGADASGNIRWLIDHFELPDPGDVQTRHPEEIAAIEAIAQEVLDEFEANSREWEKDNPTATPFSQRPFQKQDVARLVFKQGGLLSWEQGLGKTLGGLLFLAMSWRMGAQKVGLIVTANDLIDQWCRESKRFLGYEPTRIEGKPSFRWEVNEKGEWSKVRYTGYHGQAHALDQHVRAGGEGLWITHYEGICLNGTRSKSAMLPHTTVREWEERRLVKGTDRYNRYWWETEAGVIIGTDQQLDAHLAATNAELHEQIAGVHGYHKAHHLREAGYRQVPTKEYARPDGGQTSYGYIAAQYETVIKKLTTRDLCPECEADRDNGWNGVYCESEKPDGSLCGYAHYAVRVKPIASLLSTTFQRGTIVLDEITKMQGDFSKTSKALRGLRAAWWLGLTGTPIKNYIDQAYWPLWRVLGNGSTRFPFEYEGGKTRFENDFAVIEYQKNGNRRENRKLLPEVTNLSMLWRLLASSSIRRRKEETGEPMVPKYYHEIRVPMGFAQAEQYAAMLEDFPKLFAEKYPESKVVKAQMHTIMAPMLGLNWKLQYACTMPLADPDWEWFGVEGVSNFTPANLKALELAMALSKQGRKVLLGSVLKDAGKWYADQLNAKGVKALHILDEDGNTADAKSRAKRVYDFQTNDASVFCAGVKAIRLGHNLDAADAVILNGLDFDWETLDQFVARIHRLTSKNPVDVFVILPTLAGQQTITTRIWGLLDMKGASTELALDGRLIEKQEQRISEAEMIRELMERGFTVTEEAVDEVSVQEAWESIESVETWDAEGVIPARPVEVTAEGIAAAEAIGAFLMAANPDDVQLDLLAMPAAVTDEMVLERNEAEFDAIDAAEAELAAAEASALEAELRELAEDLGVDLGAPEEELIEGDHSDEDDDVDDLLTEDEANALPLGGELELADELEAPSMEEVEAAVEAETIHVGVDFGSEDGAVVTVIETGDSERPLQIVPDPSPEAEVVELPLPEPVAAPVIIPAAPRSIADELRDLKELLDEGILEPDEFKEAKTALLTKLKGGE